MKGRNLETPPLSRAGTRMADATLAVAKFKPTVDGKRLVRQYEVYGMQVTEWIGASKAEQAGKTRIARPNCR